MANKGSLLWEIRSSHSDTPSFLFGTMHVKDRKAFGFYELVCEKMNECTAFATEFDFSEVDPVLAQQATQLPVGESLEQYIRPKVYIKMRRIFLKATGLDLDHFRYSLPLLVNNMLAERLLAKDMPFSLDEELWQYAKGQEKELLGIETFVEQLEIMQAIPIREQVQALIWTGKHFTRFRRQLKKTVQLYEKGDIRGLHRSAKKSLHGLRKLLLYRRNDRMAKRILPLIEQQPTLIAIGAGHLAGGKGVLRQLKHAGCRIKPILP